MLYSRRKGKKCLETLEGGGIGGRILRKACNGVCKVSYHPCQLFSTIVGSSPIHLLIAFECYSMVFIGPRYTWDAIGIPFSWRDNSSYRLYSIESMPWLRCASGNVFKSFLARLKPEIAFSGVCIKNCHHHHRL